MYYSQSMGRISAAIKKTTRAVCPCCAVQFTAPSNVSFQRFAANMPTESAISRASPLQARRSLSRKQWDRLVRGCRSPWHFRQHYPCSLQPSKTTPYLSNQLPSTPLADLIPPTCTPSERHRSSPWKIEKVVHRIWPSGVCRTVPRSASVSALRNSTHFQRKRLTSNLAISIRIPARVETPRRPREMHNWQSLALEITPVHAVFFFIVVMGAWCFDFGDVPLDADQSDSCTEEKESANEIRTYVF